MLGRADGEPGHELLAANLAAEATMQGSIIGTPAYMAPEQAAGTVDQIDERSDVYSLGAILYQILTGRPPFAGDAVEVLRQAITANPVRPRSLNPTVPRALDAICTRAMAKQPAERYRSADDLAHDVESFLAGEPVSAYRENLGERWNRWGKRHRTVVASAMVALLLLVAAGVAAVVLQQRAGRARERFESDIKQKALEHRFARESAARSDAALAVAEMRTNRFARAEAIYHAAATSLEGEAELSPLQAELESRRRTALRLAEFYRLWDRTERLAALAQEIAFGPTDKEALDSCVAALLLLGVFDPAPRWWDRLGAEDLLPEQVRQLQEDAAIALGMAALWRTKQAFALR
jgi:hypothetical protein